MIQTKKRVSRLAIERKALDARVRRLYKAFNLGRWEACFGVVDPKLRKSASIKQHDYADQMENFRAVYGEVKPWHVRLSLHLSSKSNKHDSRPFAYVYVVWQDTANQFH